MATSRHSDGRNGFTLVELLIVTMIMAIMASMIVFAMFGATEAARKHKTEALIARIDAVLRNKWESYQTRRVPIDTTGLSPAVASRRKLDVLHDIMRMELPDRWTDVVDDPVMPTGSPVARPSVSQGYKRRFDALQMKNPAWPTGEYAGAECLYMILQSLGQEEGDDVSVVLRPDNVRDTDGDGAPEIVDGWQTPIKFLRWAPGFASEQSIVASGLVDGTPPGGPTGPNAVQFWLSGNVPQSGTGIIGGSAIVQDANTKGFSPGTAQISAYQWDPDTSVTPAKPRAKITCTTPSSISGQPFNGLGPSGTIFLTSPEPFDYQGIYRNDVNASGTPTFTNTSATFAMHPLVYSAGPNKCFGICADFSVSPPLRYSTSNVDPFTIGTDAVDGQRRQIGAVRDDPSEKNATTNAWQDNIHSHALGRR